MPLESGIHAHPLKKILHKFKNSSLKRGMDISLRWYDADILADKN